MGTLRTADDVNDALKAKAEKLGVSSTKLADDILRRDLFPSARRPVALSGGALAGAELAQRRLAKAPRSTTVGVDPKDCSHPEGRRLGPNCGACGATVKKA